MSPVDLPLRVLHVEDSEEDVELARIQLRRCGYLPIAGRVDSAAAMREALTVERWDLVLSDCSMPRFSAQDALGVLREAGVDLPFIIVSGTIAEDVAVAAIRAGAHDFVRKDKLTGLGPAVERELRAKKVREARRNDDDTNRVGAERYRALFNASPAPMWAFDLDTLGVLAVNDSALAECGFTRSELAAMSMGDLIPVQAPAASDGDVGFDDGPRGCRVRRSDGGLVDAEVRLLAIDGQRVAIAAMPSGRSEAPGTRAMNSVMDLAERAREGPNRSSTRPSLSAALAARRVLLADDDLDFVARCEEILIAHGCLVETTVTAEAPRRYLQLAPFDVVVTNVKLTGTTALEFVRTVRERDADVPVVLVADKSEIGAATRAVEHGAFGYLTKPAETSAILEVVRHAVDMHRMASLKRQALAVGEPPVNDAADRAELDVRFGRALETLWIAFQPIVSWSQRSVFGYEALVRSEEPTLQSPADLFAAAERLGRLHHLGRAIRSRAAEAVTLAPFPYRLFVNVHPEDLNDGDLYSPWAPLSAIATSVVLEITERSSLERVSDLVARLKKLRGLGFHIAVDDLGAGYAGLSSFSRLEPEVVKLDMSLVRGIDTSSRRRSVVRAMVELAGRDLGMLVICEGIETAAERDTLAALGADLLQGFLFAKPSRELVTPIL
jgi:PAS domain S-box-containing protein